MQRPPDRPAPDPSVAPAPPRRLLLAEQLAVLAIRPGTRRHALGTRSQLNACLAALLVAELDLADRPHDSPTLDAAAAIVRERGPKLRPILSHMARGLERATGMATWDLVTASLGDAELASRDAIVATLQAAAATDAPMDLRVALVLTFTGPAQLLELVAPQRRGRRHARSRIDHALDDTPFRELQRAVVRELSSQTAAVTAATTGAVVSG